MTFESLSLTLAVCLPFTAPIVAQQPTAESRPPNPCANPSANNERTFYLKHSTTPADDNEVYTAVRLMLPADGVKSYLVSSQNAIIVCGSSENFALVEKMINDLDRPRKSYRLTFTVSELDGTRQLGSQHF